MANIFKIDTYYGGEVLAVRIGENCYIDENCIKHRGVSKDRVKRTRNVPAEVRTAFEHVESLYKRYDKLDAKKAKLLEEISRQEKALDEEERQVFKELRDAQGVMSLDEFVEAFHEALPDKIKEEMDKYNFHITSQPLGIAYQDDNIYIERNVVVRKYDRNTPYCYEEYDGSWFMLDNAKNIATYHEDIKKCEKRLSVFDEISSELWTGDKYSVWYSGVYTIPINEKKTKEYAKKLAKIFAGE